MIGTRNCALLSRGKVSLWMAIVCKSWNVLKSTGLVTKLNGAMLRLHYFSNDILHDAFPMVTSLAVAV